MAQKQKDSNYTNAELLANMAKSKDPNERSKLIDIISDSPETLSNIKKKTLEDLANDSDHNVRGKVFNSRPIIKLLPPSTIIKHIYDEDAFISQMILSKREATEKLSKIRLAHIASKLIRAADVPSAPTTMRIQSMSGNPDVRARLPKEILSELEKAGTEAESKTEDMMRASEFAELRQTLERIKKEEGRKKPN